LLNYLRNKRKFVPEFVDIQSQRLFEQELDFWEIKTEDISIEDKRIKAKANPDLVEFFDTEP
jgi:hypothetical protein